MDLWVTFIGTAASVPTAARGTAATLIARGGERFLVDCGEGTQRQLLPIRPGLVELDQSSSRTCTATTTHLGLRAC